MTSQVCRFITVLAVAAITVCRVGAFENGAPDSTCDSMRPSHYQVKGNDSTPLVEPLREELYFSIHVNTTTVKPGDHVEVFLKADKNYFEGFALQARDVSEVKGSPVKKYGTFKSVNVTEAKTFCNSQGITQAMHKKWNNITVIWVAPSEHFGTVQFKATVVKGYRSFFMNVHSQELMHHTGAGVTVIPSAALTVTLAVKLVIMALTC
ncbi:unnamed protein product [Lymnaea stagnalis]|uniref:Reelin domain-containing protein n=1 Tax=Lymnaea stagnalis TaxID=6523 RepID=A0AAV2IEA0_LYMST